MSSPQPASSPSDVHYDAIVYGSGAAGLTCALTLAQQGARVALLEKNAYVGGQEYAPRPAAEVGAPERTLDRTAA